MPVPLHWHTEPLLLGLLIGTGWLYALLIGPLRNRIAPGQPFPALACTGFLSALAIVYLAVGSPIDQLGEDFLFSVHMVQHMMLIYLAAPLFLLSIPWWLADFFLRWSPLRKTWAKLTHPVTAGILFTFIYTVWHVPDLYEAALQNRTIHVLEHWTMFGSALLMWWPNLSPSRLLPRSAYGVRMIYIFLLMVGQLPVFAFLTFSDVVLYPTYEFAVRITNLTPLQDQILGGVIMKVTNMVVSLTMLSLCFYLWARSEQESQPTRLVTPWIPHQP